MNNIRRVALGMTAIFHFLAFALEALLWSREDVHSVMIPKLNAGLLIPVDVQATVLSSLFINQGWYNFFLACGAVAAIVASGRGLSREARALAMFVGCFAVGAGLVLALSTKAFAGAAAQVFVGLAAVWSSRALGSNVQ